MGNHFETHLYRHFVASRGHLGRGKSLVSYYAATGHSAVIFSMWWEAELRARKSIVNVYPTDYTRRWQYARGGSLWIFVEKGLRFSLQISIRKWKSGIRCCAFVKMARRRKPLEPRPEKLITAKKAIRW